MSESCDCRHPECTTCYPHSKPNPTRYVLGFAFSHTGRSVVLIEKQKPAWQAGKLNGIGGKVERSELPIDAMTREFAEETGHITRNADWLMFEHMMFQNGAVVWCFVTRLPEHAVIRTMEIEKVDTYPVYEDGSLVSHMDIIKNLTWLLPKAFHQLNEPSLERMIVTW